MRKINAFLSRMPKDLVEFQADIVSNYDGRHYTGDTLTACRFGYCLNWCDGSGSVTNLEEATPLNEVIEMAKKYLDTKGWKLANEVYTGADITDEIIEKCTTEVSSRGDFHANLIRYAELLGACYKSEWYDPVFIKERPHCIHVANIKALSDEMRKYGDDPLFGISKDRDIVIYTGYEAPYGYISQVSDSYMSLDAAKEKFGLAGHPDIDVVNYVVAHIMDVASKYESEKRERIEREKANDIAAETLADSVMALLCREDALSNRDTFDDIVAGMIRLNGIYGRISDEGILLFMGCTRYLGDEVSEPTIDFDNASGKPVMVRYGLNAMQSKVDYMLKYGEEPPISTGTLAVTRTPGGRYLIDVDVERPKPATNATAVTGDSYEECPDVEAP